MSAIEAAAPPGAIGKRMGVLCARKARGINEPASETLACSGVLAAKAAEFAATRKTVDFIARPVEAPHRRAA